MFVGYRMFFVLHLSRHWTEKPSSRHKTNIVLSVTEKQSR